VEDEGTSHLLCKDRHAAFGLKRGSNSSKERSWTIKASSKEGMITKIKARSLKTHLTGTQ
jgi:hypothetical protein